MAEPDAAGDAERPDRTHPFGPWTLSELHPDGVFSGFGANCNRHFGTMNLNFLYLYYSELLVFAVLTAVSVVVSGGHVCDSIPRDHMNAVYMAAPHT